MAFQTARFMRHSHRRPHHAQSHRETLADQRSNLPDRPLAVLRLRIESNRGAFIRAVYSACLRHGFRSFSELLVDYRRKI
jgi:hypothetical protein